MTSRAVGGLAAAAALLLLGGQVGFAASLDVNPVRIDLAGPGRPTELHLTNTGTQALSVQVDTRQWSQDANGADELVDTKLLLAVPPLFTVAPGERQIVRIGYLGEVSADDEKSFRIIVTELAPSDHNKGEPGLAMRLRLSIPVFVAPASGVAVPEIVVSDFSPQADRASLILRNVGNAHAKLSGIDLRRDGKWLPLPSESVNLIRYLLPNTQAEIAIPGDLRDLTALRIDTADGREWEHVVRSRR